jgi:hypothetical protein
MTALSVPLTYPLVPADQQRAINRVAIWVSLVRHKLSQQYSRDWLETTLRIALREGGLSITVKAVEAANQGDHIADAALRDVGAELQTALVQGRALAPGHLQVVAYLQRAALRAPHKRKRGGKWHDDWVRNIGICILIQMASAEFGVSPTRNRDSRRANRMQSGCSLVTAALDRNRVHLDEGSVQRHLWLGLPGELVRQIPINSLLLAAAAAGV